MSRAAVVICLCALALHTPQLRSTDTDESVAAATQTDETSGAIAADVEVVLDESAAAGDDLDFADDGAPAEFELASPPEVVVVPPCHGRWCYDADDVMVALATVGPRTRCVIRVEIGGIGYSPNAYGRAGEVGPGQLHPAGKLPEFLRTGGDPWDPYAVIPWVESQILAGQGGHWAGIRDRRC